MKTLITLILALGLLAGAPLAAQSLETFDAAVVGNPGTFPAGWTDGGGVFSWRVDNNGTPSLNTGPSGDHTTGSGNYMYCETSQGTAGNDYILNIRPFDSTAVPNPSLDFWYHMFGASMGTLEAQEFDGLNWNTLFSISGDQGNQWVNVSVPLTNPSASSMMRFRYMRGTSFTGDASIDDVTVPGSFNVLPFESNSAESSLDVNGIATDGISPAIINLTVEVDPQGNLVTVPQATITLASGGVIGGFFEIVTNTAGLVALGAGGIDLGGEVLNINLAAGFAGVNGGPANLSLQPLPLSGFPGAISTSVTHTANLTSALDLTMQAVVTDPLSPLGFRLSQGSELHSTVNIVFPPFSVCPSTIGNDLSPLSDDGSINVAPSAPFPFYGTTYTDLWVNMNGSLTFGTGDSDFTPSGAEMLSGAPRIAPVWDDWTPNDPAQGTVRTFDDGIVFAVEWFDVRHFGCAGLGDSNTFCATLLLSTGDILIDIGRMDLCSPGNLSTLQLTGISPGGGLSLANNVDLSVGGNLGASPLDAIYEDFGQATFGPFDLGAQSGVVTNLIISPLGGAGIGPYVQ